MGVPDDRQTRLAELERRIRAARDGQEVPVAESHVGEKYNAASMAWRMVIELVLGVLFGAAIGWGIDWVAGTLPIFLIIFCLLGFAGGVRTMMHSADEVNARIAREREAEAAAAARYEAP